MTVFSFCAIFGGGYKSEDSSMPLYSGTLIGRITAVKPNRYCDIIPSRNQGEHTTDSVGVQDRKTAQEVRLGRMVRSELALAAFQNKLEVFADVEEGVVLRLFIAAPP
jgi:hypothetical protein